VLASPWFTRYAGKPEPTPLLGEHTREVLREVGYTDAEIAALHASGAVKTEQVE
jgi:crotonobetainyl-CoA:carnitine CoA-transferase CaiB-like acyl-CoA transferase